MKLPTGAKLGNNESGLSEKKLGFSPPYYHNMITFAYFDPNQGLRLIP